MLPTVDELYMSTERFGENRVAPPVPPRRNSFTMVGVSVDRVEVRDAAVHPGQLFVVAPSLVGVGLGELGELLGALRVGPPGRNRVSSRQP
jgi:hypothetical protein